MVLPQILATQAKYDAYRTTAYASADMATKLALPNTPYPIRFGPIDANAIGFWNGIWSKHPSKHPGGNFGWDGLTLRYQSRRPDRLDVALWYGPLLCGLCIAVPSNTPSAVTVNYLEKFHGQNPLDGFVAELITDCADFFAKILNKQIVRIKNPGAGVVPHYQQLGFAVAPGGGTNTYLERKV